jgi:hypothetical protein
MITPKLEQLIWEGKAFFKTYVAGPLKSTLNIDNDRFIIITDIQFSGFYDGNALSGKNNIQLSIYGEKGFNHYIFRNVNANVMAVYDSFNNTITDVNTLQLTEPQTINTYLLHTTQVGFSFISNVGNTPAAAVVASVSNPSYAPPLDYGKDGDTGAITTIPSITPIPGTMLNFVQNRQGYVLPDGVVTTQQIQFEALAANRPLTSSAGYCFANVNYIEILGKPENMQF